MDTKPIPSKKPISIIVIGNSDVGKTCLIQKFCTSKYYDNANINTIGAEMSQKLLRINKQDVKMNICDTSGQERFANLAPVFYRGAQGVLLVYSISDRKSFENIQFWMNQIHDMAPKNIRKVLVASKYDLEGQEASVTSLEGKELARSFGIKFFETSAKKNIQVKGPFYAIAQEIVDEICGVKEEMERPRAMESTVCETTQSKTFLVERLKIPPQKKSGCC